MRRHIAATLVITQQTLPVIAGLGRRLPAEPLEIGSHTTGRVAISATGVTEIKRFQPLQQHRTGPAIKRHMMEIDDEFVALGINTHQRDSEQWVM